MSKPFTMTKAADIRMLRPDECDFVGGGDDLLPPDDSGAIGGDDKWTIMGTIKVPFDAGADTGAVDPSLGDDKVKLDARK